MACGAWGRASLRDKIRFFFVSNASSFHQRRWILYPTSWFRRCWNILVTLLVVYISIAVPYRLAFGGKEGLGLNVLIEALFWVDIVINFRTAFSLRGVIVSDARQIALRYFKGWFLVDLMGSIPWESLLTAFTSRQALRIWALVRLVKLLRMGRLIKFMRGFYKFRYVVTTVMLYGFFTHWFSCVWFFVRNPDYSSTATGVSDSSKLYLITVTQVSNQLLLTDRNTTTTTGQHFLSLLTTLVGIALCAVLWARVSSSLGVNSDHRDRFRAKMDGVRHDMAKASISESLQKRINNYYAYLWLNHRGDLGMSNSLLHDADLSGGLRKQLACELTHQKGIIPLRRVMFFRRCGDELIADAVRMMMIRTHVFMPNEFICFKGDIMRELLYLSRGRARAIDLDASAIQAAACIERVEENEPLFSKVAHAVSSAAKRFGGNRRRIRRSDEAQVELANIEVGHELQLHDPSAEGYVTNVHVLAGQFIGTDLMEHAATRHQMSYQARTVSELHVVCKEEILNLFRRYQENLQLLHDPDTDTDSDSEHVNASNEHSPKEADHLSRPLHVDMDLEQVKEEPESESTAIATATSSSSNSTEQSNGDLPASNHKDKAERANKREKATHKSRGHGKEASGRGRHLRVSGSAYSHGGSRTTRASRTRKARELSLVTQRYGAGLGRLGMSVANTVESSGTRSKPDRRWKSSGVARLRRQSSSASKWSGESLHKCVDTASRVQAQVAQAKRGVTAAMDHLLNGLAESSSPEPTG